MEQCLSTNSKRGLGRTSISTIVRMVRTVRILYNRVVETRPPGGVRVPGRNDNPGAMITFPTCPSNSLNLNNIPSSINIIKIIYPFWGHFCIGILLNFISIKHS